MTIKNITLSAIAATVMTTAALAGTVSNPGNVGLIGQEKISISDVNVSAIFGGAFASPSTGVEYVPTAIPATSLKNPIFKFTFANAKNITPSSTTAVFEVVDGNASNNTTSNYKMVAKNPQISGTNNEIISFNAVDANTYAYNNKTYVVADSNTTDANGTAAVVATVVKGSTSDVTLQAELYSGDSQAQADLAPATSIAKVGAEYIGSVTQKFDARIDASNSFKLFYDQNSDGNTLKADDAIINLHKNATLAGASLGATNINLDVLFDQNTSTYITGQSGLTTLNDLNVTGAITGFATGSSAHDTNTTLTLTNNGTAEIKKTQFTAHAYVVSGTNKFDVIAKSAKNAGEWSIYGYNAQIPNVASTSAVDVTMKFTNRSSIPADIFFTLIDPKGTVVTLNSKDYTEIASIPANQTGTYKASTLVPLATAKDANFDASGSFSVEVSIPTTPTNVYGMASFKNLTLGQFKDLPVYNNGVSY